MKIRDVYLKETKSYAAHTPQVSADALDCSLGVNPYGPPDRALEAVRSFDLSRLGDYPHTHAAHDAIIRYWSGQAALTRDGILLADGSVSALYLVNALFAKPGAEVVGFAPSFTDMIVNAEMQGMRYTRVAPADGTYREDVDALLAAVTNETALVYVDNPNNPTGQTLSRGDLRRILERAEAVGAYVLVDEAYGDFISREESAMAELGRFPGLMVLRTFSKGFGLAGLRAGYLAAAPELVAYMSKTSNPYTMNELTREAAAAAMEAGDYPASHGEDFARVKRALRGAAGHALTMLETDDRVPICTLKHRDAVDLQMLLARENVLTVSGAEFDCMDESCVRLRVPRLELAERLVEAVGRVDRSR